MPRRIPSFPVSFEISRPTRFSKAQSKMYFANEWEEYQKSLHHDDIASTSAPAPENTHATDNNSQRQPLQRLARRGKYGSHRRSCIFTSFCLAIVPPPPTLNC